MDYLQIMTSLFELTMFNISIHNFNCVYVYMANNYKKKHKKST